MELIHELTPHLKRLRLSGVLEMLALRNQQAIQERLSYIILVRYERGSIVVTSNRAPTEWPDLFGDPLMTSAALDRLADRAHVLVITGASYRARDCQILGLSASPGPLDRAPDQGLPAHNG